VGRKLSAATRAKISASLIGNKNAKRNGLPTRQKVANINAALRVKRDSLSTEQIQHRQKVAQRLRTQARKEERVAGTRGAPQAHFKAGPKTAVKKAPTVHTKSRAGNVGTKQAPDPTRRQRLIKATQTRLYNTKRNGLLTVEENLAGENMMRHRWELRSKGDIKTLREETRANKRVPSSSLSVDRQRSTKKYSNVTRVYSNLDLYHRKVQNRLVQANLKKRLSDKQYKQATQELQVRMDARHKQIAAVKARAALGKKVAR
jgi:hypothetical protein